MTQAPQSRWTDIDGPVHYVDHGGSSAGPTFVLVHGLGGSLVNWLALGPMLTSSGRVLALDLAGHGHTRSGSRSTTVHANRELLSRFLHRVSGTPVILVGNSMGGLITILQASQEPQTVSGAVLIDPALPPTASSRPDPRVLAMFSLMSVPALGRRMLAKRREQTTPEQAAMDTLRLCTTDVQRVSREVIDAHVEMAAHRRQYEDTDAELLTAAQSLVWVLANRRRYQERMNAIRSPVLLLQGAKDRLVPVAAARTAARQNPSWTYAEAADLGHVPQLEDAAWTAGKIRFWLEAHRLTGG